MGLFYPIADKEQEFITGQKSGLRKVTDKKRGDIRLDALYKTSETCPFCGSVAKKDKEGNVVAPFIVDKDTCTYKTLCCYQVGGPGSYVMQKFTRGPEAGKNAVKWLKQFCQG